MSGEGLRRGPTSALAIKGYEADSPGWAGSRAVSPGAAVVLPMDGFHYSRAELRALDPPDAGSLLPRRGSPWTFDAEGLCASLTRAKAASEGRLPVYCRVKSDPVPARC